MTETIRSIPVTAPMWNGADFMTLKGIIECLSTASYHYADNSGGELGRAYLCKMEAAALINKHKLSFSAISALYKEELQLLALGEVMDAVLKDARK